MARVEGTCSCQDEDCVYHKTKVSGWVDVITGKCRQCEIGHGDRWGHHGAKAEEASQKPGERTI